MILIIIISLVQFFKSNIKPPFFEEWPYSRALGVPWRLTPRKAVLQSARGALDLNSNPNSNSSNQISS